MPTTEAMFTMAPLWRAQERDVRVGMQGDLDTGQILAVVEVGDEHIDRSSRGGPQALRKSFQPLRVACDQDQVVAAVGEAVGIDRAEIGNSAAQLPEPLIESDLEQSGAQLGGARFAKNLVEAALRRFPRAHRFAHLRLSLCCQHDVTSPAVGSACLERQQAVTLKGPKVVSER